jgi:hypothetical protein
MAVLQMFAHTMLLYEDFSRTTMHQGQNNDASRAEQRCIKGRTTYFVYAHFRVEE